MQSSLNGTDYLYAEPVSDVCGSNRHINVCMKHALARIRIKFVKDGTYLGRGMISGFSLAGDGIGGNGILNIFSGALSADPDTVSFSVSEENGLLVPSGVVEDCIIVPVLNSDIGQDVFIRCMIDGQEFSKSISGVTVRQGMQTDIEINVKNVGLSLAKMDVGFWDDDAMVIELGSGKTVRVELSEEVFDNDILLNAYAGGSDAVIEMLSKSGYPLVLDFPDGLCTCTPVHNELARYCSYTISDVKENIVVKAVYDAAAMARTDVPDNVSYYKDIFLDAGQGLDNFSSLPLAIREMYGGTSNMEREGVEYLLMGSYTSGALPEDTLTQRNVLCGCEEDLNGALLYPDGEPRFKVFYSYGGRSGKHGEVIGERGMQNVGTFYANGGGYVGSCAGTFLSAPYSGGKWQTYSYRLLDNGGVTGSGMNLEVRPYYTDIDLTRAAGSRFYELCDLGGKVLLDSLRHNGGCALDRSRCPAGVEELGLFGDRGGYPLENFDSEITLSNPRSCIGKTCLWAYKRNQASGRLVVCGSHPEMCNTPEINKLYKAELLYAMEGFGNATAKATLFNGRTRVMDRKEGDPGYCGIGDNQYHHFVVFLPKDVAEMSVTLDWDSSASLDLGLKYDSFAFLDSDPDYKVKSPFETPFVEHPVVINARNLSAGMWYISVHCQNKVQGIRQTKTVGGRHSGAYWYKYYKTQNDVDLLTLNGVPYRITASWIYK